MPGGRGRVVVIRNEMELEGRASLLKTLKDDLKPSDIMVMGVIFIPGEKKEKECMLLTQTSGHSVPL